MADYMIQAGTTHVAPSNPLFLKGVVQAVTVNKTAKQVTELDGEGADGNVSFHDPGKELSFDCLHTTETPRPLLTPGTIVQYDADGEDATRMYIIMTVGEPRTGGQFIKTALTLHGTDKMQASLLADARAVDSLGDTLNP